MNSILSGVSIGALVSTVLAYWGTHCNYLIKSLEVVVHDLLLSFIWSMSFNGGAGGPLDVGDVD